LLEQVDVNMKRAHRRNAAREQKFYFRKKIFNKRSAFNKAVNGNGTSSHSRTPSAAPSDANTPSSCATPLGAVEDEYAEYTVNELINGDGKEFPGLLGLINAYIASLNVDVATKCELDRYLNLIKQRADGLFPDNSRVKS
jgi:glutamate--cysteine ligase catalytic subunit